MKKPQIIYNPFWFPGRVQIDRSWMFGLGISCAFKKHHLRHGFTLLFLFWSIGIYTESMKAAHARFEKLQDEEPRYKYPVYPKR